MALRLRKIKIEDGKVIPYPSFLHNNLMEIVHFSKCPLAQNNFACSENGGKDCGKYRELVGVRK